MGTSLKYIGVLACWFILCPVWLLGQQVAGVVKSDMEKTPISGVNVYTLSGKLLCKTDVDGTFEFQLDKGDERQLRFLHVSYSPKVVDLDSIGTDSWQSLEVSFARNMTALEEVVVNTGYYVLPKERATGSFETINASLFNRNVGSSVMERLEGIVSGLHFDRRQYGGASEHEGGASLRLRGISTVYAEESPLIILNNFPFDGNLADINPNDIESVTVLKDAAAASIWGARAGNGVIVLTTKGSKRNAPTAISINSNFSVSTRPDLLYGQSYIGAKGYIELEEFLFANGVFDNLENNVSKPYLSPVVESLIAHRDGEMSSQELQRYFSSLEGRDFRREAQEFLYRPSVRQQYAASFSGSSNDLGYLFSVGHDAANLSLKGSGDRRFTLNADLRYALFKDVELETQLYSTDSRSVSNGLDYRMLPMFLPYQRLVDDDGQWLPMGHTYRTGYINEAPANGLLDWSYNPLKEQSLNDLYQKRRENRMNFRLQYKPFPSVRVGLDYLYSNMQTEQHNRRDSESYYVRNMVNRYTQEDGTRIFPEGDILWKDFRRGNAQNLRLQVNFNRSFADLHDISALAGAEWREVKSRSESFSYYGYDDDVLTIRPQLNFTQNYFLRPAGSAFLPVPPQDINEYIDRFISYYFNGSYSYGGKYIVSSSLRWDASNLFGVRTNQKGTPLWSVGLAWDAAKEGFLNKKEINQLKFRLTHGASGNMNKSVTAYPTISYSRSTVGNYPTGLIRSPGNPDLRWEQIHTTNLGLDAALFGNKLTATAELYWKRGKDLFGEQFIDPTIFFAGSTARMLTNYADMDTRGFDLTIGTGHWGKEVKWSGNFLFSKSTNTLKTYRGQEGVASNYAYGKTNRPIEGKSIDILYSVPWEGLEPTTGDPLVMEGEELSKEYTRYLQNLQVSDLIAEGTSVPIYMGSLRQGLTYRSLTVSANLTFKADYFFRKPTVSYSNLLAGNARGMHQDYYNRWQQEGDEVFTNVPSRTSRNVANRDLVYSLSSALVGPGDHVRLQDVRIDYTLSNILKLKHLNFYFVASNLGVIWKKNKVGIDPDYPSALHYLPPKQFAFGFKANY